MSSDYYGAMEILGGLSLKIAPPPPTFNPFGPRLFGLLYRARLHEKSVRLGETLLPDTEAASWALVSSSQEAWRWAQVDSRATLDCNPAWVAITVKVSNRLPVPLNAAIDAGGAGPAIRRSFTPGEQARLSIALPATGRELRVWSETAVPAQLGVSSDRRVLGIAVDEICYHEG
jgi:hypothetical protein